jgi:hypothetical protein
MCLITPSPELPEFLTELPEFLMPVSGCAPYVPRIAAFFFASNL